MSGRLQGSIEFYRPRGASGFGVILLDDGRQAFFQRSAIKVMNREPDTGEPVTCEVVERPGKNPPLEAVQVWVL